MQTDIWLADCRDKAKTRWASLYIEKGLLRKAYSVDCWLLDHAIGSACLILMFDSWKIHVDFTYQFLRIKAKKLIFCPMPISANWLGHYLMLTPFSHAEPPIDQILQVSLQVMVKGSIIPPTIRPMRCGWLILSNCSQKWLQKERFTLQVYKDMEINIPFSRDLSLHLWYQAHCFSLMNLIGPLPVVQQYCPLHLTVTLKYGSIKIFAIRQGGGVYFIWNGFLEKKSLRKLPSPDD